MMMRVLFSIAMQLLIAASLFADEMALRNNLRRAKPGDFVVTLQQKNYTLLLVRSYFGDDIGIEEITVPVNLIPKGNFSWRSWVQQGASCHTAWIYYRVNIPSGTIQQAYSFSRHEWISIPQWQNFMTTLLNLPLYPISERDRKRVGPPPSGDTPDRRPIWQPKMVVDGQEIAGVAFEAWRTRWPKDGSELSGKAIEIYLPKDSERYPSYFPFCLQVSGMVGKGKVRIVDAGKQLFSPARVP